MATAPAFAATPKVGVASVSTANTARDGTGTIATVLTAGSSGTKVYEIAVVATSDPADSTCTVFLHDGTNFWYFDEFDLGNPAAASATVAAFRTRKLYDNLVLPTGWTLRAAVTVALTAGVLNVFAFGGDL
jgi:hypothetical protein